ncbi:hypothetical protein H6G97_36065 [Nostoc flagelliforme FACHB-838]|uniref:Transposase n=1 Tax=Nostoc flagelliforme FACHB-838 TaxID=2692904 RepID=A0ABR8DZ89_9NOSO|nr:hypothetical protein [Nostoc flagelliforme FACHB-838]
MQRPRLLGEDKVFAVLKQKFGLGDDACGRRVRHRIPIFGVAYLRDDLATSKILPLLPLPPLLASIHPTVLQRLT